MSNRVAGIEQEYAFVPVPVKNGPPLKSWVTDWIPQLVIDELNRQPSAGDFHLHGGHIYLDNGVVELTTPETATAQETALYAKANDKLVRDATDVVERKLRSQFGIDIKIRVLTSASDPDGNTRSCHENYQVGLDLHKKIRTDLELPA